MSADLLWKVIFTLSADSEFFLGGASFEVEHMSVQSSPAIPTEIVVYSRFSKESTAETGTSSFKLKE
jgi:hypothetical protein